MTTTDPTAFRPFGAVEWQPIETAPRDGTVIDLWAQSMMLANRDSDEMIVAVEFRVPRAMWWRGGWRNPDGNSLDLEDFTNLRFSHWMPEPAPPAVIKETI